LNTLIIARTRHGLGARGGHRHGQRQRARERGRVAIRAGGRKYCNAARNVSASTAGLREGMEAAVKGALRSSARKQERASLPLAWTPPVPHLRRRQERHSPRPHKGFHDNPNAMSSSGRILLCRGGGADQQGRPGMGRTDYTKYEGGVLLLRMVLPKILHVLREDPGFAKPHSPGSSTATGCPPF